MDARTTSKTKLPSRHVTEGPERAPHRSYLFDVAEVFKRTPCVADLKPGGRYVAKDLFEVGGVPLLMKTLLDHLWKYAQQVGPALAGAVTHPGGAAEKECYADI